MGTYFEERDDYKTMYVNTHRNHKVLTEDIIGKIRGLNGVEYVFKYGSYGMELFVVYEKSETDFSELTIAIENIIQKE